MTPDDWRAAMGQEAASVNNPAWSRQTRRPARRGRLRYVGRELLLGFTGTLLFAPLACLG
ncbi:hypothetical protein [Deinococcus reticulitermitis]|nr:hypothetical protein [Deinococcus reticulitermitis]